MGERAWTISDRCDPAARPFADRHYNRQSIGAKNFCPPGRCFVLSHPRGFWVTSWPFAAYVKHAWAGAWVCSAFRLEGGEPGEASALITQALAATLARWSDPPAVDAWAITRRHDRSDVRAIKIAMVTFVDERHTREKRDPGRCFRRAGFVDVGRTKKGGLVALGLPVDALPEARACVGSQMGLGL